MKIIIKNNNTLLFDNFKFKCSTGKKGHTKRKKEGDLKTPRGTFTIGPLFYRKDKYSKIDTKLKKIIIKRNMGWCDDPESKTYNKLIKINKHTKCSYENMFRKDRKYDLLIPINYNTKAPKKNKGSAIFIHLTNNYEKTEGCIALKEKDMIILVKLINKKNKIKIF